MDRTDKALLAAYLLTATLGTATSCLLVNDGAVLLTAGWLGNAWDLYFSQIASRAVSVMFAFGPAWVLRAAFGLDAQAYMAVAHLFYFAAPLVLWLGIRLLEATRLFSRLYLATMLALLYFPSELIVGAGLWVMWLAVAANQARTTRAVVLATSVLGAAMAFTHPALALMSFFYLAVGATLGMCSRQIPRRSLVAAAGLTALLLASHFLLRHFMPPTNRTVAAALAGGQYDYVDPTYLLASLAFFPALAALWLLLLAPGAVSARLRWRFSPAMLATVTVAGAWFAVAGTGLLTWLYARHTAAYVLPLAIALALVAPEIWHTAMRRPLISYAAIAAISAVSYNVDLFLFGRFVDRAASPGITDVDATAGAWPPPFGGTYGMRSYFKWAAGTDYQRDVVVPMYDWYRVTLAFYSYFRSGRRSVLFHATGRPGEWVPFECAPIERARAQPHDEPDRKFLAFLDKYYCVR